MEMWYKVFYFDISKEYSQLRSFFYAAAQTPRIPVADIRVLDQSLHHRGVSVPSDEPLCISTLMSLPLGRVLAVEQEVSRFKFVSWKICLRTVGLRYNGELPLIHTKAKTRTSYSHGCELFGPSPQSAGVESQ